MMFRRRHPPFWRGTGKTSAVNDQDPETHRADNAPVDLNLPSKYFKRRSFGMWVAEWVAILLVALCAALLVKTYVLQTFYIPSPSMESTLMIKDRVLVNKLIMRYGEIKRGDIVVFDRPSAMQAPSNIKEVIKRVIAIPGDTVEARGGKVYVNAQEIDEPYVWPAGTPTTWPPGRPITLGKDQYFVMGDNRENSQDARIFGPIDKKLIVGRAILRWWPLDRFDTI